MESFALNTRQINNGPVGLFVHALDGAEPEIGRIIGRDGAWLLLQLVREDFSPAHVVARKRDVIYGPRHALFKEESEWRRMVEACRPYRRRKLEAVR